MIPSLYSKFQEWAATGSIYIISDPHFDDADCKLMNPNWIPAQEHIDIINASVHKSDTLICLGDCGDLRYIASLKAGKKILIKGNHDDKGDSVYLKAGFDEVYSGPLFIADRILLSHEPICGLPFCVNIHGHRHNGEYAWLDNSGSPHLNLAADVIGWQVFNLGKAIKLGLLSQIQNIHRLTIDYAAEHSLKKAD